MTDNDLLARIDERVKTIFNDVSDLKKHIESLPCTDQQIKVENIDGRLRPIEKIFWKLIIGAISFGSLAGGIAGAIAGR